MGDSLVISTNMFNVAPSQYINTPFSSVVRFNGKTVFFGPSGIYEEGGDTDNGTYISAWVDTPNHDLGSRDQKSVEAFSLGCESDGEMEVTLYGDEDEEKARTFVVVLAKDTPHAQQDFIKTLRKYRYGKARYWKVRLANRDGSDFSLDYLALAMIRYKRRAF